MTDLVSGVLTRISELEQPEIAARGDHNLRWTLSGEAADQHRAECRYCDWSAEGLEREVNPLADEHAVRCVSMPISEVLRLCRAHRQIVEQYQRAQELLTDGRFTGSVAESNEAAARSLRVAVEALAVGLGVVEEDR